MIGPFKVNHTTLRKTKIVYNFGLSECSRVKLYCCRRLLERMLVLIGNCLRDIEQGFASYVDYVSILPLPVFNSQIIFAKKAVLTKQFFMPPPWHIELTMSMCVCVCVFQIHVQPITSLYMMGLKNHIAQMIILTRQCVACKNHVARSKVKVTVALKVLAF